MGHKTKGTNMSILDSILRIFIAIVIGAVSGWYGWWIGIIAIIPLVSGLSAHCFVYDLLGISTIKDDEFNHELE